MLNYVGGFAYRAVASGNTQVRRLAYLTAITKLLSHSTVSVDQEVNWLMRWATDHDEQLKQYARLMDGQGAIVADRRTGPLRYIDLAHGLLLVARTGGAVSLSPYGELLRIISSLDTLENPFFLSPPERLFYIYWLLLNDADFLLLVIDAAFRYRGVRLQNLQSKFKQHFIERLEAKRGVVSEVMELNRLDNALYRAQHEWIRPERYAEHVVPPRANWLLDLGFFEPDAFRRKEYVLSVQGERLRSALPIIPSTDLTDVTGDWLWQNAFTTTTRALDFSSDKIPWGGLTDEKRQQILKIPIANACQRFPLIGMRACSLLPALVYCVAVLTHLQGVLVDLGDLASWIGKHQGSADFPYELHMSSLETESYISVANELLRENDV